MTYRDEMNAHKKRLRRFDPEVVIIKACQKFRWVGTDIQKIRLYPHNELYYIIKLAIKLAAQPYTPYKPCTDKDFDKQIENQKSLAGPQLKIAHAEGDPLEMGLKWLAQFCQFPFQDEIDRTSVARSIFLYELENCPINIREAFERETQVPLRSFFQGCFGAWVVANEKLFIQDQISGSNLPVFNTNIWDNFIPLIRADYEEFRILCATNDLKSDLYEMFSAPVILKAPVIRLPSGRNIVPWPMLLLHRLCYGPYDILKAALGNDFTDAFGFAFQKYITRILSLVGSHTGEHFYEETASTSPGKTPDFFSISDATSTLLCVEAKANEDSLTLNQRTLMDTARPIIGKAIVQCHDLWQRATQGREDLISPNIKKCIPLIVTFRPFYFVHGNFYRNNVVNNDGDEQTESLKSCSNNYQVMDIRAFECLAKVCVCSGNTMLSIVETKLTTVKDDDWWSYLTKQTKSLHEQGRWNDNLPGITDVCDKLFTELEQSINTK